MSKFWKLNKVNNSASNEADLFLYGDISSVSWWGDEITPKQFADDLAALGDVERINVRINSGGGDVFAGQAIHSTLKRHKAEKVVYVDGLAASIASVIAMAGDKIVIPKNAMMMIHNPWTRAVGNSNDMREMADFLDKVREPIIAAYEDKTGKTRDELIKLMDAETWMTAEEAVSMGFADEVESKSIVASMDEKFLCLNGMQFELSGFQKRPKIEQKTENNAPSKVENKPQDETTEETLAQKYPDLIAKIKDSAKNEGIQAERQRIKAIEELGIVGHKELVNKAKFENALSPEQTAHEIVKADKKFKESYLADRQDDSELINGIKPVNASSLKPSKEEAENSLASLIAKGANLLRK